MAKSPPQNRYARLIERVFFEGYTPGSHAVPFTREQLTQGAQALGIELPKNLGDVIYTFRFRVDLPDAVTAKAPPGRHWVLALAGRGSYRFEARRPLSVSPSPSLAVTKILDSTPGIVASNALNDEQALLAVLRYNRLIDLFTGFALYALQSHLRTTVPGMGQVETDDLYVGHDRRGAQVVVPVQAKGGRDRISEVQIEQDLALCAQKFPALTCLPIAAQFIDTRTVALFAFERQEDGLAVSAERHYRLVGPDELSVEELRTYAQRID